MASRKALVPMLAMMMVVGVQGEARASLEPKTINVALVADWERPGLLSEASEVIGTISSPLYWNFIDEVAQSKLPRSTDQQQYRLIMEAVEAMSVTGIGSTIKSALNYSISIDFYAPKIQMIRQLVHSHRHELSLVLPEEESARLIACKDPIAFFVNETRWACGVADLKAKLSEGKSSSSSSPAIIHSGALFDFDITTVGSSQQDKPKVILYGDLASEEFGPVHRLLRTSVENGELASYTLRQVDGSSRGGHGGGEQKTMPVQGYGVELAIKSQEYKVLDDELHDLEDDAEGDEAAAAAVASSEHEEIDGFYFSTLKSRRPGLEEKLESFRQQLLSRASDEGDSAEVKVWDVQDLGVQTVSRIKRAKDPLAAVMKIAQDFPMYAPGLAKLSVNQTIKASIIEFQRQIQVRQMIKINKDVMTGSSAYELHDLILKQASIADGLLALDLSPKAVRELMAVGGEETSEAGGMGMMMGGANFGSHFKIDMEVRHEAITWLNDLEGGGYPYGQWAQSIREFLKPAWPNQMRYIAKNLHRLLVVIDPSSPRGLEALKQARFFVQANAPLTVGLVFDLRSDGGAAGAAAAADDDDDGVDNGAASPPACTVENWPKALEGLGWAASIRKQCDKKISEAAKKKAAAAAAAGSDDGGDDGDTMMEKEAMARLFFVLKSTEGYGDTAAWEFAGNVADKVLSSKPKGRLTRAKLKKAFLLTAKKGAALRETAEETYNLHTSLGKSSGACDAWVEASRQWVGRKGLKQQPLTILLNGAVLPDHSPDEFRQVVMTGVLMGQMKYQHAVYRGQLTDETDLDEWVSSRPNTFPRLNDDILKDSAEVTLVDSVIAPPEVRYLPPPGGEEEGGPSPPSSSSSAAPPSVTHWVVANMRSVQGRVLVAASLEYWESMAADADVSSRIAIMHNAEEGGAGQQPPPLARALSQLSGSPRHLALLGAILRAVHEEEVLDEALEALLQDAAAASATATDASAPAVSTCPGDFCTRTLGLTPGENAMVANGRVVRVEGDGSYGSSSQLLLGLEELAEDLRLHDAFMAKHQHLNKVAAILQKHGDGPAEGGASTASSDVQKAAADRFLTVCHGLSKALAASSAASSSSSPPSPHAGGKGASIPDDAFAGVIEGANVLRFPRDDATLAVVAVLDPLTMEAQKLAPILLLLRDALGADVTVFLSPSLEISEVPLKRFYRAAIGGGGEILFDEKGQRLSPEGGGVSFSSIRSRALLTMNMEAPEGWLIASRRAPHDLDNLMLDDLAQRTQVQYGIDHALIQGQCIDMDEREPPAGLQLELGNVSNPKLQDTLVMYNLGYFQLKANPGLLRLRVAPNRHGKIYRIEGAQTSSSGEEFRLVPVMGFKGTTQMVTVRRRVGMEKEKLLESGSDSKGSDDAKGSGGGGGGILGSLNSLFSDGKSGGKKEKEKQASELQNAEATDDGETVHVFSLASGQLYERFLKIMMQSVVANTKSRVKFWFLSNFLSPQFKAFLPKMAAKFGFDVALVTYQWPTWLHQQTVKQRVIWGYKILFLDVLFPLDLKRIIYIDADQVVRGDVKELWNLDLKGAPYGYTPFCNTNTATNGFRFWDSGYWKNHLRGKPYHISALYVVDLVKFRRMRAGDTLRSVYDNLSADPNSLSNLDQDLPNYTQHTVPIFSLPQEWLWCETWCSMETLKDAKTIDLCNNPLTKKPKLEVAKELLPEWSLYDERQRNVTLELND